MAKLYKVIFANERAYLEAAKALDTLKPLIHSDEKNGRAIERPTVDLRADEFRAVMGIQFARGKATASIGYRYIARVDCEGETLWENWYADEEAEDGQKVDSSHCAD